MTEHVYWCLLGVFTGDAPYFRLRQRRRTVTVNPCREVPES